MSKATYSFVTLALLVLAGAASAAPVSVELQKHNQRSSSGTLSTLKWAACAPVAVDNACLSTSTTSAGGIWSNANATPSNAVWTWDAATGVLSMTGIFQSTSFISSNANGSPVISDKVVDMVIDTVNNTTTGSSYICVEGTFLASVGANGCLNTGTGADFTNDSSALYDVGGNALCVQRTVGGDDTDTGNPRGLTTVLAAPPCDAQDGAFDLWDIQLDDTATGGQLIIRGATPITDAGANFLTFAVVPDAVDDGPFNAPQGILQTLNVLANDVNFTDPVTVTVTTAPTKGVATVTGGAPANQADIRIEYTANGDATGPDSFVYTVLNSDGLTSDTATVTLNTLAFGANDDDATTTRNSAAIPINVGANDVGLADDVTIAIISAPDTGGTATPPAPGPAANAIVTYTPATTAPGTATYVETFTYEVTDANLLTSMAMVSVTVNNTVPVAGDAGVTISTQGAVPGTGAAITTFNAGTFPGNSLGNTPSTVTFTQGANGAVTASGNLLTYTPAATFFQGTDFFDYTITDSDPGTAETDTGRVTVTITDLSPVLANATITTTADTASAPRTLTITLGNGSAAQHPLAVTTQAGNGSCALSSTTAVAGTSVTYTPNAGYTGGDSCVVTITDEDGTGDTATGTLTITVNAAAGGGGSGGLLPGGSGAFDPWSLALLAGLPLLGRLRASQQRVAAGIQ